MINLCYAAVNKGLLLRPEVLPVNNPRIYQGEGGGESPLINPGIIHR